MVTEARTQARRADRLRARAIIKPAVKLTRLENSSRKQKRQFQYP